MTDPTINYAAAIEAVRNATERYNLAVQTLADAEEYLERRTLEFLLGPESALAAYMAHGSNETARKERRTLWVMENLSNEVDEVRTAKKEKADAEMELDHARRLCTLERLRCEWLMQGGSDLLGPEPPVGRLPADPRVPAPWRDSDPTPPDATALFQEYGR